MAIYPVSPKQLSFIESLTGDQYGSIAEAVQKLDTKAASIFIDTLLKSKRAQEASNRPAPPPVGFHFFQERVYRVRESKSGNLYATEYCQTAWGSWEWAYVGRKPFRDLSESTIMSLEDGKAFGHRFGICIRCGAVLSDEVSINQGMGPVCIKKWPN